MIWVVLVILGIITGLFAGFLGIGGGVLVVPGLLFIFKYFHLPTDDLMHFAIGSSLVIMIATNTSALITRSIRKEVEWRTIRYAFIGIIIGSGVGAYSAHLMPSFWLEIIFGIYMFAISVKLFMGFKTRRDVAHTLHPLWILLISTIASFKSGFLGTGAGSIMIPLLYYIGFSMRVAAGTASMFSVLIAISASIVLYVVKLGDVSIPWATGYIYWPAVLCVAPLALAFAMLGVYLSKFFSNEMLRKIFAILLFLVAIRMLIP